MLLTSFLEKLSVCSRRTTQRFPQIHARRPSSLTLIQPRRTIVCVLPAPVPESEKGREEGEAAKLGEGGGNAFEESERWPGTGGAGRDGRRLCCDELSSRDRPLR